jgi:hypothetical protein
MIDNYGSLTIYNFKSFGQEYINWDTGYGTFNNPIITGKISGSYKNVYGQTVTTVINLSGTINPNGYNGSGNWSQTKMKFRERPYLESITIAGHKKKHKEKTSKIKVP